MHNFPPNTNWRIATLLTTLIGFIISDDFTAREQIVIGNWFLQIGQTMVTNAQYQLLIETRILGEENINLNGETFKCGGSPFIDPTPSPDLQGLYKMFKDQISDEDIANLHKAIQKINEELEKITKDFN